MSAILNKKIERIRPFKSSSKRLSVQKKQQKKTTPSEVDLLKLKHEANCVFKIISILSKQIEPKYCPRPRNYWLIQIHKKPDSKYFKLFCQIYEYLLELRGEYNNPTEGLIYDYLSCIYKHYQEYRRSPNLNQLRPYASNQVHFIEWIHEWEQGRDEDYWVIKSTGDTKNISEKVDKILNSKGKIITDNTNITEVKR